MRHFSDAFARIRQALLGGTARANRASTLVSLCLEGLENRVTPDATFVVNSTDDFDDGMIGDGKAGKWVNPKTFATSLRSAIEEGNAQGGTVAVTFEGITELPATIALQSPLPALDANFGIFNTDPEQLAVSRSAAAPFPIFQVASGRSVGITGLWIKNGDARGVGLGGGGGVVNEGDLTLSDCWISENVGEGGGGVLSTAVGRVTIQDSKIWANTATGQAGAAGGYGGGVAILGPDMTTVNQISDCQIYANEADGGGYGGGVYVGPARVDMQNTSVTGNVCGAPPAGGAGGDGGGIANFAGVFTMTGGTIELNDANGYGGGFYSATTETGSGLSGVSIDNNWAGQKGGGMYVTNAHLTIDAISLTNNTATGASPELGTRRVQESTGPLPRDPS